MSSFYITPNDIGSLHSFIYDINKNIAVKSILLFMAFEQRFSEDELTPVLNSCVKPIIGGVFPEVIFEGTRKKTGVLIISLPFHLNTQLINLADSPKIITKELKKLEIETFDVSNGLFVFYDAISKTKNNLTKSLYNFFGTIPTYIGGGAGSLNFTQFPCIINNNGFHRNASVIGLAHHHIAIGASHGWKSISNPLKVTKSNGNEIISINWKPAFTVYKEIVEKHSNKKFEDHNFFDIAKSYPLGISKMDAEKIVRDPFKVVGTSIHFIDAVSEGEYIEVLNGNIESLLKGARDSKNKAIENQTFLIQQEFIFCVDCISRALFMDTHFHKEIEVMNTETKISGILSIGEIANYHDAYLEIYNKTNVIAIW